VHRPGPGDRGRDRAALTHWLLVRGSGDRPLERTIDAAAITAHSSSKRPSVERGELAVLYAAVWQAIFGVVEIAGEAEHDANRDRWAWRFPIRPLAVLSDLDLAPPLEAAGVFPHSLWRHSHIRLRDDQFSAARRLIETAASTESRRVTAPGARPPPRRRRPRRSR
jgi:hypothetical protein